MEGFMGNWVYLLCAEVGVQSVALDPGLSPAFPLQKNYIKRIQRTMRVGCVEGDPPGIKPAL